MEYRWVANQATFVMPIKVGRRDQWQTTKPTMKWQTLTTDIPQSNFGVATDLYYVNVKR